VSDSLTVRARQIVRVARSLLESEGPKALTMRRVADQLNIRAPSLYKHFPDKEALEVAIIVDGFEEAAAKFEAAEADTADPQWRRRRFPVRGRRQASRHSGAKAHPCYRTNCPRPHRRAAACRADQQQVHSGARF